ncbi:MAG: hypothetical protein M3R44_02700 [Candidatus Eremiobacteraeota bacterium]|nr:hypothetical protein [Candidatus Eremiobacteraeota bacterium]
MNEENDDHNGAACRVVDGYLLGERVTKAAAVAALLSDRSNDPALAPFYRAFETIGVRAADEAIVALRLLLAGREASDASVRRLRTLARIARAASLQDVAAVAALQVDPAGCADLSPPGSPREQLPELEQRTKQEYFRELGM